MPGGNVAPRSVDELVAAVDGGLRPSYLFFWGHTARGGRLGKACLSQWYPAPFLVDDVVYPTAEHWMMAEKARLFGDVEAAAAIVAAGHPKETKLLGRRVKGFDQGRWERERFEIVVRGNREKFGQNPDLVNILLGTGDRVLVEASPEDRIWGIGLAESDRRAYDPRKWRGLNLLGFALMRVRSDFKGRAEATFGARP